mgnify:FL=1|jgi:Flp pilus assembly protein TadB
MKKRSDLKHSLTMAIAWTFSASLAIALVLYRDATPLRIAVAALFTVDALLWWLRWYRLKDDYKKQEEQNHE